jgi:hypothetical protein
MRDRHRRLVSDLERVKMIFRHLLAAHLAADEIRKHQMIDALRKELMK